MDGNGSKRSGTGQATRKGPWTSLKEVIQYLPVGGVKPDVYCDVATDLAQDYPLGLFDVCAPWARSNGCKSRTCPDSGKCIAEQQGCLSRGRI